MTKKRSWILELFRIDEQPLCAQQVYEKLKGTLDMATVYRGLKYLEGKGHIVSFVLDCSHRGVERYYNLAGSQHRHFLHCVSCHSFTAVERCPLGSLNSIEKETGFKVDEHFLTLKGICSNCRNN
ncbi:MULTISPECIES: Fur family transcriptional regulator [unclassified Oceanispirochaeta]|uniref:Fur family transcriptional regulator n=1 Tax=unclassified Oceanispirochaeta TaxID=2635722 RepID=UPI001313E83B|nr:MULTISPECIES: transcriptional repressor [unclassified Oceanispirochaeta]MBF9016184.1 transcriptional repressor [Oceanispirochaeta sp. M2]NPD72646.1 transcriptional repressor [Oceanispirochaeta sp. M1]